jgi:hypothetical protein
MQTDWPAASMSSRWGALRYSDPIPTISVMEPLTDRELEEYCFLHLAFTDLAEAESTFDLAIQFPQLVQCLVVAGVIAYARPFQNCRGKYQTWNLSKKEVPKERRVLHRQLLDLRNQFFAHTDLKAVRPRLLELPENLSKEGKLLPGVGYLSVNCQAMLGDGKEIRALVRDVRANVKTRKNRLAARPPFRRRPLIVGQE